MARSNFNARNRVRFGDEPDVFGMHALSVAAAVIGSAVVGAAASSAASSSAADSADAATAAQSAAAKDSTAVAQARLDFEKQQWAEGKDARDRAAATADQVAQQQLASSKQADDLAKEYNDYRKSTFQPLEQQIVSEATGYDTPERRAAAATAARTDVDVGYARSADAQSRRLAAAGINPGSARAIAAMGGSALDAAKTSAGASTIARKGVEDTGTAMKLNAVSLGRNLPANQNASANTAISAGNSAVNNSTVPVSVNATPASLSGAYAGLSGAYSGAASTYGQVANAYQRSADSTGAAWSALGSTVGNAAARYASSGVSTPDASSYYGQNGSDVGFYISDEEMKTDVQAPSTDQEALAAVNATPVKKWRYDPAKMAANGIPDDGAMHEGPMAQDVAENMGQRAAPGGKKIDPITMNGVTMRGLQAVDKKVERLAKQVSSIASMVRSGKMEARAA